MFKKIVSNLPYSPSLLPQVGFYVSRLQKENVTRKLGIVFAGLTIVVQFLIVVASPVPSIASDSNDLIRGGLRSASGQDLSQAEAKTKLVQSLYGHSSVSGLKELFEFYGIDQQDIESSHEVYICSKEEPSSSRGCTNPDDRNLRSIGRDRNSRDPSADVRIQVPGRSETYYHRPLHIWDSSPTRASQYKALSINNGQIYILYSCGNIVFREPPETNITTSKSIVSPKGSVKPGDILNFRLSVANTGNSPAYNVKLVDRLNPNLRAFTPIPNNGTVLAHNQNQEKVEWNIGTLSPGNQAIRTLQAVVIKNAEGKIICNRSDAHYVDQNGSNQTEHSEPVACIDLDIPETEEPPEIVRPPSVTPSDEPEPTPEPESQPPPQCLNLAAESATTELIAPATISFKPTFIARDTNAQKFVYYINNSVVQESNESRLSWTFSDVSTYKIELSITFSDGTTTNKSDCSATITTLESPNERVDLSKSAQLISSFTPIEKDSTDPRSDNLHQQTVKANELIQYKLLIQNSGNVEYENFEIPEERISDVLEYANPIDSSGSVLTEPERIREGVELLGGGFLKEGVITWSNEKLFKPGEQIEKIFIVQIKDPIPETNQVSSNPLRYDCQIDNTYSNTVTVYIDCPFEKQIEKTISDLPNTGASQSFTVVIFATGIAIYLYQRNKLISKELVIIKEQHIQGV